MSNWRDEKRACALKGCTIEFYPEQHNQKYCCEGHKQAAENRRYYQNHRNEMILRVLERRKAK